MTTDQRILEFFLIILDGKGPEDLMEWIECEEDLATEIIDLHEALS